MIEERLLTPPDSGLPPISFQDAVAQAASDLPTTLPERPSELFFALDIDGTLMGQRGVSDHTRSAIARAEAAGAKVVIATGRGIDGAVPAVAEIGLSAGWSVCSNGALTVRWDRAAVGGHDIVESRAFDPRPVAERILQGLPEALLGVDLGSAGMRVSRLFPPGEIPRQVEAAGLDELLGAPVNKLVGRAPGMSREDFVLFIDSLDLNDVEHAVGWTSWVDIGPFGVTKATGLQGLADRLGVPASGTVAIGDGLNDLAMLRWAAHGVAMGGSDPAVIAAADAVTAPVEFDGAAAVIEAVLREY